MKLSARMRQRVRLLTPALLFLSTWAWCSGPKPKAENSLVQVAACTEEPGELPVEELKPEDYPEMGCVSVENGSDAFSTCARTALKVHGSTNTSEAIAKLRSCLPRNNSAAMLIGHGKPGSIRTGGGNLAALPNQEIGGNGVWQDALRGLDGVAKKITLFSCHTGAETSGRTFVDQLHTITNATVSAQNSMVFCSNERKRLYLHTQNTWTVSPGIATAPTGILVPDENAYRCLRLVNENGQECQAPIPTPFFKTITLTAIETPVVNATAIDLQQLPAFSPSNKSEESHGFTAQLVQRIIGFCQPVKLVADARVYGRLILTIDQKQKSFNILDAGSLLQDTAHPEVLYLMDQEQFHTFESELSVLLKTL